MTDGGGISRRALLGGGAGSLVVLAGLGATAGYEIDHRPSLRRQLFGCGGTPAIPASTYRVTSGTTASRAMRADMPWVVAVPADHEPGRALPVVLCLPGAGGLAETLTDAVGLPGWATAAGLRLGFACPGGEASTYYHPRAAGTDSFAWVTEEFLPMAERRFGMGGSKPSRGVFGWSMGGFGALLVAQRRPDLVCAAVAASPAVFPSYHAAVTPHGGTFDSAADWSRWGLWNQAATCATSRSGSTAAMPTRSPTTARQLMHRVPGAVGQHQQRLPRQRLLAAAGELGAALRGCPRDRLARRLPDCKTDVRFGKVRGMPKVSPERLAATRRRVLDGARRAFAAYGYEGATVRRLEEETGLSRGAIFHHFADKDALFLALAAGGRRGGRHAGRRLRPGRRDAQAARQGRRLARRPARGVAPGPHRSRSSRALWQHHLRSITRATQARLARQRDAGVVRDDVPIETLAAFLLLVYDGLVAQLATGMPVQHLDGVLDLAEQAVREPRTVRDTQATTRGALPR